MQDETIVAVYDTAEHAEAAVRDLVAAGIPESAISHHSGTDVMAAPAAPEHEQGFWSRLFGGEPDHDTSVYDRSVAGGSTVVTVHVSGAHVDRVVDILDMHAPIDLEERATGYGLQTQTSETTAAAYAPTTPVGYTGAGSAAADNSQSIQLSEERLAVGKRVVNLGGTRVRRFVVETPVEEQVSLHSERVTIDRRPVTDGRAVGTGAFTETAIEMTEMAEEAVVAKTAHVVEEVNLHKHVTDTVETVRDTLKREEVEIETLPAESATTTTGTTSMPSRAAE